MKKRRNFWAADTLIFLLAAACAALAVMLVIAKPAFLLPVAILLVVLALAGLVFIRRWRRMLRRLLNGRATVEAGKSSGLSTFSVPAAAVSDGVVVWYNDAFLREVAGGADCAMLPLARVAPGVDIRAAAARDGQRVPLGGRSFTVYGNRMQAEKGVYFCLFIDNTELHGRADEYVASRPAVLYIVIDTYDEILKELRESERARIVSGIDMALERFIGKTTGFLRRVTASRYLAVVEERHLAKMIEGRFDILDEVRSDDENGALVTLSIGVGRQGATLKECEDKAHQALDMALGRGGDQAAVNGPEGFEFYGGVTRSVEKRTKVKSRIIATAIKDLMQQYDRVLVMGHRDSDMDCVGAAVGMLRFCRICKKPAAIVIDATHTLAGDLVENLQENGYGRDLLAPDEALGLSGGKTLLIVVDTHMIGLLESREIYNSCGAVVVIDHHRKMVGHIDNAAVFYHEPYASSASELVSELLQYVGDGREDKLAPVEAEALLSGIMLDTRTFSLHVGVRTFEAAAYLRRMGAQTANVKKLFASTMDEYLYRSHLVSEAKTHMGCAVSFSDKVPPEYEVVAPQAANELLTISGVRASFVGIRQGDTVRVSARSMGEVNVQLIMEKLGGGGHLTMAGAQLKGAGLEEAEAKLEAAISEYMKQRTDLP